MRNCLGITPGRIGQPGHQIELLAPHGAQVRREEGGWRAQVLVSRRNWGLEPKVETRRGWERVPEAGRDPPFVGRRSARGVSPHPSTRASVQFSVCSVQIGKAAEIFGRGPQFVGRTECILTFLGISRLFEIQLLRSFPSGK